MKTMSPRIDHPQTPNPDAARLARAAYWSIVSGIVSVTLLAPVMFLYLVTEALGLHQYEFLFDEIPPFVLAGSIIGAFPAGVAATVYGSIGAHESNDYNRGFARAGRLLGLITLLTLLALFLGQPNYRA